MSLLENATLEKKKRTWRDVVWETETRLIGCDDWMTHLFWRHWGFSLNTIVDAGPLEDHGAVQLMTTICIGPLQIRSFALKDV